MTLKITELRPDLAQEINGELSVTRKGFAYLCGITEEEAQAEWERQGKTANFKPPKHWIRQGRENAARIGLDNMMEALLALAAEREGVR